MVDYDSYSACYKIVLPQTADCHVLPHGKTVGTRLPDFFVVLIQQVMWHRVYPTRFISNLAVLERERHGYSVVVLECAVYDAALPAAAERQLLKPVSEANADVHEFLVTFVKPESFWHRSGTYLCIELASLSSLSQSDTTLLYESSCAR